MSRQAHDRQLQFTGEFAGIGRRSHKQGRYGTPNPLFAVPAAIVEVVTGDLPETPVPQLPPRLTDPRPVLAVGTALWLVATIVVWCNDSWADARPICLMGLVVGLLAYGIFAIQRRGARRGNKGAQKGL